MSIEIQFLGDGVLEPCEGNRFHMACDRLGGRVKNERVWKQTYIGLSGGNILFLEPLTCPRNCIQDSFSDGLRFAIPMITTLSSAKTRSKILARCFLASAITLAMNMIVTNTVRVNFYPFSTVTAQE